MFLMWLKLEKKIPAIALLGNMLLLPPFYKRKGFTGGSDGKPAMHETWVQSPVSGRSTGEGIGYPLQYSWASLVAQLICMKPHFVLIFLLLEKHCKLVLDILTKCFVSI